MARRAKFTPKKTTDGWCVNVPARLSSSGKRERHFYKTRQEALDVAAKLREQRDVFGEQARAISPSRAEDAQKAAELLAPFGVSLVDAAKAYAERQRELQSSASVEAAWQEFLKAKEGRSERQVKAYELARNRFVSDFEGRPLASITGRELVEHVEAVTGGPRAFNHRVESVRAFWRWCAREPRAWCDSDVARTLEMKEVTRGEIQVLTAKECRCLLQTAEKNYPETALGFAIALFTGMRKAELERLTPGDISDEGITVPATSAKIKRRRFVEMTPTLAAWLKSYPAIDSVLPANWVRREKAVRRLAGWGVWCDLVDPAEPPEDLPKWPANALRHTHASAAIALGKPIESLIFEFGHSGGVATLKSYYAGVMPKKDALKIGSIGPDGQEIAMIGAA